MKSYPTSNFIFYPLFPVVPPFIRKRPFCLFDVFFGFSKFFVQFCNLFSEFQIFHSFQSFDCRIFELFFNLKDLRFYLNSFPHKLVVFLDNFFLCLFFIWNYLFLLFAFFSYIYANTLKSLCFFVFLYFSCHLPL